ncbi:hypothetical protein WMY93_017030 [Mugilogobius chulae]|uniref:Septin-type G domain-containing protein n=1 Tax=Mugilogobius chulae TaxID=88201 RepID=A0AAW0NN68_9GOBI
MGEAREERGSWDRPFTSVVTVSQSRLQGAVRRERETDLSRYIKESNRLSEGPPARYQRKLERVNLDGESDEESKLRKFTLGERDSRYPNKTILLVGETGSGKSTLVNALANFVMGVNFEDKVWFEIIPNEKDQSQTESQTAEVSVYEIFGCEGKIVSFSLTIIDTPGFGDTKGIEHDDIIMKKLLDLFSAADEVDLEKNIVAMITHSDGMNPENALHVLENAQIKYAKKDNEPVYFQFNNRQKDNIGKRKNAEKYASQAFEIAQDGMSEFTDFLSKSQPQSLKTTTDVLKERSRLTACIENLQERVKHIEEKQRVIKKNIHEVSKVENYNSKVVQTETYKDKKEFTGISGWFQRAVSCVKCMETCHKDCTWAVFKSMCEVMESGRCTVCPGKCPASDHVREKWFYVTKTREVEVTIGDWQKSYEVEEKKTLLEHLQKEMEEHQRGKDQCLDEAYETIEKLEKIALSADSSKHAKAT